MRQRGVGYRTFVAALVAVAFGVWADTAAAHVKWFCAFSVARQPDTIHTFVNSDFWQLVGLSIGALIFGTIVDETFAGRSMNRALFRLRHTLPLEGELLIRTACGFFLICIWHQGGIILTPELKTSSEIVSWIQLGMAACLVSRRTAIVTGIGLVGLYLYALKLYGFFHLADYPIFLGVAAYLVAVSLRKTIFGARPIDVLRWATAITLMWASVEKWAYPEWAYPLFVNHGALGLGVAPPYYMLAAGVVEFTLAFALLGTPLVRFYGAIILTSIFTTAIFSFGKLDAVGHAPIIGVLLAIVLDDYSHEIGHVRPIVTLPVKYCGALAAIILIYYGAHAAIYNTAIF